MTRALRWTWLLLATGSLVWIALAVPSSFVRYEHRALRDAVRPGTPPPEPQALAQAIADYDAVAARGPCHPHLHSERATFRLHAADQAMAAGAVALSEAHLDEAIVALQTHLRCSPMDGGAWINLAMLHVRHEGFGKRALDAYRLSAAVAPQEAWLAEKRLKFALEFYLLFDGEAMGIAQRDIAVLERALLKRQLDFAEETGVGSLENLTNVFAQARPAQ